MPTAVRFVRFDKSPIDIFFVQALHIGIQIFGIVGCLFAVQHGDVALVNQVAQHTDTGIPLKVLINSAFDVGREANQIAFVLIKRSRLIIGRVHFRRVFFPSMPRIIVHRLITIETIKIAHSIGQIAHIHRQAMIGNQIFGVVEETKYAIMFGRVRRLDIKRMNIFRILRTITIIINVGQRAALKTKVGIVGNAWQCAKIPAGFDFFLGSSHRIRLLSGGYDRYRILRHNHQRHRHKAESEKYSFHSRQLLK